MSILSLFGRWSLHKHLKIPSLFFKFFTKSNMIYGNSIFVTRCRLIDNSFFFPKQSKYLKILIDTHFSFSTFSIYLQHHINSYNSCFYRVQHTRFSHSIVSIFPSSFKENVVIQKEKNVYKELIKRYSYLEYNVHVRHIEQSLSTSAKH